MFMNYSGKKTSDVLQKMCREKYLKLTLKGKKLKNLKNLQINKNYFLFYWGEPNDDDSPEECIISGPTGWADVPCTGNKTTVCQKKPGNLCVV